MTDHHDRPPTRIVVGVDGSDPSKTALAWAARYAEITSSPLAVVMAWQFPTAYGWAAPMPEGVDFESDLRDMLEQTVGEVLGPHPSVDLSVSLVAGHPSTVLTEQSKTAALVVVASRGHGEFTGMLLGSVSEFLTTHAHCPVVVVRDGGGAGPAPSTR